MPPRPAPAILSLEPYKGGEAVLPGIAQPIKLSSNENPFGASPKARAAFAAAVDKLHIYPEGSARKLREAIAARYGLDPARIVCGAGSDEIFFLVTRAFLEPGDDIVVTEFAFLVYAIAAKQCAANVRVAKNDGLTTSVDAMLAAVTPRTKIVFLDNPNNPTGSYIPFSEVRRLHEGLPSHVLLVIDAAYAEYVRRNDYSAGLELAAEADNVIMTRTFSKIYGLAAARLGWAYGAPSAIDALNRVRGPFNVSTPAMHAGIAAIEDQDFADKSADHNERELARVAGALSAAGYDVAPSVGNFVLVRFKEGEAAKVDAHLRANGYIVRAMKSYGLPDALRITIGTTEQNDGLLKAMSTFVRA